MSSLAPSADAIDSRVVLRWYALAAGSAGVVLIFGAPLLVSVAFSGTPLKAFVFARTVGALMVAGATAAWAVSRIDDEAQRHRGFGWCLGGTALSMVAGIGAVGPGVASSLVDSVTVAWATACVVLVYVWDTAPGERLFTFGRGALSIRPVPPSQLSARSRYEDAIRRAAAQEERHRLARDLHDSVKQQLFAINTAAATAQARLGADPNGVTTAIDGVRASARDALAEMDAMLDQLREAPIEMNGLIESLRRQCESLRLRTGADVTFECSSLPPSAAMAPGVLPEVLRVAHEALANVARHARARRVTVVLAGHADGLSFTVSDDGRGFDGATPSSGMGLSNMRARAVGVGGTLDCRSSVGAGTTVSLVVPANGAPTGEPRPYLNRAIRWGLLLFLAIGSVPWRGRDGISFLMVPMVAVAAFAFLRSIRTYQRLRSHRYAVVS